MFDDFFDGAELVAVYTRAQAIADGALVDVSALAAECGFRVPVAVTASVWQDCIEWNEDDSRRQKWPQDQKGRLWDVLHMAAVAAKSPSAQISEDRVRVTLYRVTRFGKPKSQLVKLEMVIGPGDDAEPVITIMFPGED